MSDQVLTAMLSAGQNVAATAAQAAPQPIAQPAPTHPNRTHVGLGEQQPPARARRASIRARL